MPTTKAGIWTLKACKAFKKKIGTQELHSSQLVSFKYKDKGQVRFENSKSRGKSLKWAHPEEMSQKPTLSNHKTTKRRKRTSGACGHTFNYSKTTKTNTVFQLAPRGKVKVKHESSLEILWLSKTGRERTPYSRGGVRTHISSSVVARGKNVFKSDKSIIRCIKTCTSVMANSKV